MQILILYYSKTGNTRKLDEAIANGVTGVEGTNTLLKRTDEVTKDGFLASDGNRYYFLLIYL